LREYFNLKQEWTRLSENILIKQKSNKEG